MGGSSSSESAVGAAGQQQNGIAHNNQQQGSSSSSSSSPPSAAKPAARIVKKGYHVQLPPQPSDGMNTVKKVFLDDVKMIDSRLSQRMPPLINGEIQKAVAHDAARICYEVEKKMARCCQDKFYTVWKCQKERDAYYQCLGKYKADNEILNSMRWKYNLGTFHGEIVARRRLMQALWNEYFPDREINHEWAQDS